MDILIMQNHLQFLIYATTTLSILLYGVKIINSNNILCDVDKRIPKFIALKVWWTFGLYGWNDL